MSTLDWWVLFGALGLFVLYGVWKSRGERNLTDYLLAGRSMPWPMVALSVMATQASAVTFLSAPGQGFKDGLRFVQFYFGLPLAMIAVCVLAIPIYHRLRVFTAYEYLEGRFDGKTRSLAVLLFLVQRGLAAGITIYAPALVLAVVLGWDVRATCALIGGLVVIYTMLGGSNAVGHTQALQFSIILGTLALTFVLIARALPSGVGLADVAAIAGQSGRLRALSLHFDPNDRYTLWSGLIGGFFLQLSYFGADQSQVGRYLAGRSIAQSRMGLLFNGLVKIPMQLGILLLGVVLFGFYLFTPPPLHFDPAARAALKTTQPAAFSALEDRQFAAWEIRRVAAREYIAARRHHDPMERLMAATGLQVSEDSLAAIERDKVALLAKVDPHAPPSDVNFVFLSFVIANLPAGIIGLVFAAVFAASMNASSAELNALTSTTVVDVIQRLRGRRDEGRHGVWVSRIVTLAWAAFAVLIADAASRLGSLIEAVNILGSLFYGTILGIFLTAFLLKHVRGTAVFAAALIAEAAVIACFKLTAISFLWYNLIGCALVMGLALVFTAASRPSTPPVASR